MAWLSGWDKRIKIDIGDYAGDIGASVTWFPVTVFLTATQCEEVFVELTTDEEYLKVAFTKADGTTELYGDCELFDASEEKGIFHISRDGWVINTNTSIYLYYDADHVDNTTYIGKSGGTAAQSVYDANFKVVHHMVGSPFSQVTGCENTNDWSGSNATIGTSTGTEGTNCVTVLTTAAQGEGYYNPTGTWDWSSYTYLHFYQKHTGGVGDTANFTIYDSSGNWYKWDFTMTDSWTIKSFDLSNPDASSGVVDYSLANQMRWQITDDATTLYVDDINVHENKILDSTSNNDDGTKIGINRPTETTLGKISKAQDFEASTPDYITLTNTLTNTNTFTISAWMKTESSGIYQTMISNYSPAATDKGFIFQIWGPDDKLAFNSSETWKYGNTAIDTNWHHVAVSLDASNNVQFYLDGGTDSASIASVAVTAADTDTQIGKQGTTSNYFDGIIDEQRFSASVRNAAWIKGEYNSGNDSLLTYGSEGTEAADNAIFFGMNF